MIGKFYAGRRKKHLHDVKVGSRGGCGLREVLQERQFRRLCEDRYVVQQRLCNTVSVSVVKRNQLLLCVNAPART